MPLFLLVYDQRLGRLIEPITSFEEDEAEAAMARRFALERSHADRPSVEVVLLGAASVDALRSTHRRYFMTPAEIAASL